MKKSHSYLFVALFVTMLFSTQKATAQYTIPAKMNWWYESRFGMFIHFGSYSYLAKGEWAMSGNYNKTTYQTQVSSKFNPAKFNGGTIARLAKKAGMKYLVITAKHHEGFCMWPTAVKSFKSIDSTKLYDLREYTPFDKTRDIIKELKDSCDAVGVKFCLYYSILDWSHPSQEISRGNDANGWYTYSKMASTTARASYIADMKAQLKELIDNYHPAILWFDGDWTYNFGTYNFATTQADKWWTKADGVDLQNYLRGLDPNLLMNERVFRGAGLGDWDCSEGSILATANSRPWETCQTMNNSWGYNSGDHSYKATKALILELVQNISRDGNYLLNIGPKDDGTVPSESIIKLDSVGNWMDINGSSIYGATRSPFSTEPAWGLYTKKSGKLYAHVFVWPTNGLLKVPSLINTNTIKNIYMLNDTTTLLKYKESLGYIRISLPANAPNPVSSVVVIDVTGLPAASTKYTKATAISVTAQGGSTTIQGIGGTLQMSAAITPTTATDKTVTWIVSDATIASISNTGLLTAKKVGSVTVTATANDDSEVFGQVQITVGGTFENVNLLQNSDFEMQGAWMVTQRELNGPVNATFGTSGTGPQTGSSKFLELKFSAAGRTSQVFVYQKVVVKRGHTYKFSAAMKDVSSSLSDDWIRLAYTDKKPIAGKDISESAIATFGSGQACDGKGFDGLIETSCAVSSSKYFKIPTTLSSDTIYFGINVATYGATSNIDLYFDNVTLIDSVGTTSATKNIKTSSLKVTPNPANNGIINLEYNNSTISPSYSLYDILGREKLKDSFLNQIALELRGCKQGTSFVVAENDVKSEVQKFLVN